MTAAGTYTIPDVGTTGFTQGQLLNTAGVPVTISRQSASTFTLFGAQTGTALTSFSLLAGQAVTFVSSPNTPSRQASCGRINRRDNKCSRR